MLTPSAPDVHALQAACALEGAWPDAAALGLASVIEALCAMSARTRTVCCVDRRMRLPWFVGAGLARRFKEATQKHEALFKKEPGGGDKRQPFSQGTLETTPF